MSDGALDAATPVGSVLAYAGKDTVVLDKNEWLPCDGRSVPVPKYPELHQAIAYANGGTGGEFNLPDLRGWFVRGVDGGAGRDPDADTRTAAQLGGNPGDLPGSVQAYATAVPRTGMRVNFPNLPEGKHKAPGDGDWKMAKWRDATTVVALEGGGRETRPLNGYVHFVIKAAPVDGDGNPVKLPAGCVVPFAGASGASLGDDWLLCDGSALDASEYPALFEAIGIQHGGNGRPTFYLPDYRGYFLRGVSGDSRNDPGAEERTAPQPGLPSGQQGASGNHVGSVQGWATGSPHAPFTADAKHLPNDYVSKSKFVGHNNSRWDEGAVEVKPTGGDRESRPVNLYLDWYIRVR